LAANDDEKKSVSETVSEDSSEAGRKAESATDEPDEMTEDERRQAKVDRLGTGNISKLITEFALPAIAGMLFSGLYNIIDGIFMGHGVGPVGLATATVAMPIMQFSMAVSTLLGAGGNALLALRMGEGRRDQADKILGVCFTMSLCAALFCTVMLQVMMTPFLKFSGVSEELVASATTYIRIVSSGLILQFLGMGYNNYIRTAGDPFRAFYTSATGVVVSFCFNFLFVLVLKWGVAGSATAQLCGQAASCAMVMSYFVFGNKAPFKVRRENIGFDWDIMKNILKLGSASFIMQFTNAFISLTINNTISYFGALSPIGTSGTFAGLGVMNRISGVTYFPIMGCAVAAQPLFGYNYGAKNYERVRETYFTAFRWMVTIGCCIWILIQVFATRVAIIFGVDGEILAFTARALRIAMFMVPIMGLQMLSANYFQSTGQPMKSLSLSLSRSVFYMLPLMNIIPRLWTIIFPDSFGVYGIPFVYPSADTLAVLTATLVIRMEFRRLKRLIAERDAEAAAETDDPPSEDAILASAT